MQFEEFDKKVREAADHHHPAYNEKAWAQMEKLLDKHMPREEDDRRRFIFLLLLFLLLGGGAWLMFGLPGKGRKTDSVVQTNFPAIQKKQESGTTPRDRNSETLTTISLPKEKLENTRAENNVSPGNAPFFISGKSAHSQKTVFGINKNLVQKNPENILGGQVIDGSGNLLKNEKSLKPVQPAQDLLNPKIQNKPNSENAVSSQAEPRSEKAPVLADNKTDLKTSPDLNQGPTPVEGKKDKNDIRVSGKKSSSFFLSVSAGPDASMSGLGKPGKVKIPVGLGLGYTYKDRFTLRSGFYTARKIYTAPASDYHAPSGFNYYYPNLEKVEADCKVYEIPVQLSYHFGRSGSRNYFASAGLSSYLMKKETYNFYYKYTAGGPTVNRQKTIKNGSQLYFSVLTLSGGYQLPLSKTFSLVAEPYVKVPLQGVGFGKVKLNSGGVMFSLTMKPFQQKNKRK